MALNSTFIANRDAVPSVLTTVGGELHRVQGVVEAAGETAGAVYRFNSIPSNARNIRVFFACDDLGTGLTLNVGIHQTTSNGGAVVDADFFADAIDVATAAVAMTDITYERSAARIADADKPLWEQLGLTADTQRDYDITGTSVSAAATGTMILIAEFVV